MVSTMPATTTVDHDGDAIRSARQARGLTIPQLAALVGTTRQTISNIERSNKRCSEALFNRIATALDVPPATLLARAEDDGGADLLTLRAAGKRIGCSESHIRRLIAAGALRAVDISADPQQPKTRVRVDDLRRFIDDRTRSISA